MSTEKHHCTWLEHRVSPDEVGWSVESVLTQCLQISRRRLQRLTRSRGIRLNRRATFLSQTVQVGDVVAARAADSHRSHLSPVAIALDVVYEDGALVVVNKPPNLPIYPTHHSHEPTLVQGLLHHYQHQGLRHSIHPVHRLDRHTSGLIMVAKTPGVQTLLENQLRAHTLQRTYWAIVHGQLTASSGTIDALIGPHSRHPRLRTVRDDGQPARTHFQVIQAYPQSTLVAVQLETGRTHQIRVHFAHLGHPLMGDRPYGGSIERIDRQALHAIQLTFTHPVTQERLSLEAPLPSDIATLIQYLGQQSAQ